VTKFTAFIYFLLCYAVNFFLYVMTEMQINCYYCYCYITISSRN